MKREAITIDPATGAVTEISADQGRAAFDLDHQLDEALLEVERGAIRAARLFYEIKHWGHFRALGFDTFWEYVAGKRQGRTWAKNLIDVHQTFRLGSGQHADSNGSEDSAYVARLCQIGAGQLAVIAAPYAGAENDDEREEWLSRAEVLSRVDLEQALNAANGIVSPL